MCHTRPGGHHGPKFWKGPGFFPFPHPGGIHRMKHHWRTFMPYDIDETATQYIITMPLPGFDAKDLDVSVKGNYLYIDAKKPETEVTDTKPRKHRRFWNRPHISVKIYIDEEIKPESVKAILSKGLLTITVEKVPGTKVDIQA